MCESERICQPFNVQIVEKNKSIKKIAGRIINNDRYYIGQYMFNKLIDLHKWKWQQQKKIEMLFKWQAKLAKVGPWQLSSCYQRNLFCTCYHLQLQLSLFSERNLIVLGPLLLWSTSFYACHEFPNPV